MLENIHSIILSLNMESMAFHITTNMLNYAGRQELKVTLICKNTD